MLMAFSMLLKSNLKMRNIRKHINNLKGEGIT